MKRGYRRLVVYVLFLLGVLFTQAVPGEGAVFNGQMNPFFADVRDRCAVVGEFFTLSLHPMDSGADMTGVTFGSRDKQGISLGPAVTIKNGLITARMKYAQSGTENGVWITAKRAGEEIGAYFFCARVLEVQETALLSPASLGGTARGADGNEYLAVGDRVSLYRTLDPPDARTEIFQQVKYFDEKSGMWLPQEGEEVLKWEGEAALCAHTPGRARVDIMLFDRSVKTQETAEVTVVDPARFPQPLARPVSAAVSIEAGAQVECAALFSVAPEYAYALSYSWEGDLEADANGKLRAKGKGSARVYAHSIFDRSPNPAPIAMAHIRIAQARGATLTQDMVLPISAVVYDGAPKTPAVSIQYNKEALVENVDYRVRWEDNVEPGDKTARAIATGMGDYTGEVAIPFSIAKARRSAPESVETRAASVWGKSDGALLITEPGMQYRAAEARGYADADGTVAGLAAGTYFVRYAPDARHEASPGTPVSVGEGAQTLSARFDPGYPGGAAVTVRGLKYGSTLQAQAMTRAGYVLDEWRDAQGPWDFSKDAITQDTVLHAIWRGAPDTEYAVVHLAEGLGGGWTHLREEKQTGVAGKQTEVSPLKREGFSAEPIEQKEIAADSSTVVFVRYRRVHFHLRFTAQADGREVVLTDAQVPFGTSLEPPAVRVAGFAPSAWSEPIPDAMPARDCAFVMRLDPAPESYRVEHYLRNAEGAGYTLDTVETVHAALDREQPGRAAALGRCYTGFLPAGASGVEVEGDVIKLHYERRVYALSLGTSPLLEVRGAGNYAYGARIQVSMGWVQGEEGNIWDGWESAQPHRLPSSAQAQYAFTMPAGDVLLTPLVRARQVSVAFDAAGGTGSCMMNASAGDALVPPDVRRPGYALAGWTPALSAHAPAQDTIYTAVWSPDPATPYKVEHWVEDFTGGAALFHTQVLHGESGRLTRAAPLGAEGFEAGVIAQDVIEPGGGTVVRIAYARKRYRLLFLDGDDALMDALVPFGARIAPPDADKPGWDFSAWSPALAPEATMPARNCTFSSVQTARGDTPYKVEHWFEQLDGSWALRQTTRRWGVTGADIEVPARDEPGFSAAPSRATIAADGSTTAALRYARNTYALSFDLGDESAVITVKRPYASPIEPPPLPQRPGFAFAHWTPALTACMPDADTTFTAVWIALDEAAAYTVTHHLRRLDGGWDEITDTHAGTAGSAVWARERDFPGFVPDFDNADGAAHAILSASAPARLSLYYERKLIRLTFDAAGGTGAAVCAARFGEAVALPAVQRDGHEFVNWEPLPPSTMPDADAAFAAQWRGVRAAYSVLYMLEDADGSYALSARVQLEGGVGETVRATPRAYPGWTWQGGAPGGVVTQDGSLTLTLYYARDRHALTFDACGGEGGETRRVPHGAPIVPPRVLRPGYVFAGWNDDVPEAMPPRDLAFTARWIEQSDARYRVEHYKERLDGTWPDTPDAVDGPRGATGVQVEAIARTFEGFGLHGDASRLSASGTVRADGTLTLRLYYVRATHALHLDVDGDGHADETLLLKFGAPIPRETGAVGRASGADAVRGIRIPTRAGYRFNGWSQPIPSHMPARDSTISARWIAAGETLAAYTVEHHLLQDGDWVLRETDVRYAAPGDSVSAHENTYSGYCVSETETGEVPFDGSLRLISRYVPRTYAVDISLDAGVRVEAHPTAVRAGDTVTLVAHVLPEYVWEGWEVLRGAVSACDGASYHLTMPEGGVALRARAQPRRYVVSYELDFGLFFGPVPGYYAHGEACALPVPQREAHTFVGWAGLGADPVRTIPLGTAGDLTLRAVWRASNPPIDPPPVGPGGDPAPIDPEKPTEVPGEPTEDPTFPEEPEPTPPPQESGPAVTKLAVGRGGTMQLPKFRGADVTWRVEDDSIARLTKDGVRVKGIANGSTRLFLTVNAVGAKAVALDGQNLEAGKTYEIALNVRVRGALATGITLNKRRVALDTRKNTSFTLRATVQPASRVKDATVFWTSENPAVATVDRDGTVRAVAPGKAIVRACTANLITADVRVTVAGLVTKISIRRENGKPIKSLTLRRGDQFQLLARVNPDALDGHVTWESTRPRLVSVDEQGRLTAHKKGTATIRARASDGSGITAKILVRVP